MLRPVAFSGLFVLVTGLGLASLSQSAEPRITPTPRQAEAAANPADKFIVTVARSTPEATRKGEGDVIELADGRLLLVYMEFSGTGSDFAKTRFVAQESADGGRTWARHR
ncbi:MAG: sialidase family protein, partial [Planctomycetaceae bacterium]